MQCFQISSLNRILAFVCFVVSLVPMLANADPREDAQFLHVSISLGGGGSSVPDGLARFDHRPVPFSERVSVASAGLRASFPDSARFAGLAGALNLAIDTSNGQPLVEGIALAPRETLRFAAGSQDIIRGIQGHISIQLDF